ncbi:universal stress protein [bacterium]|nr:universal stress protein [bacterium]
MSWLPKKKIVVPLDFSDFSMTALKTARELVSKSSDLYIIHVIPPLTPMEPGVIWPESNDMARIEHAEEALAARLSAPEYEGAAMEIRIGSPSREVADFAEEIEAELIVIHSHGRTGAAHLLIGSVAEHIVRYAHCPVLVLRD